MQEIKSAGRALSQQRAEKIAEMFRAIANLLIETGAADVDSLKEILDGMVLKDVAVAAPLEAGQLEEALEENWEMGLYSLLDAFRCKFYKLFEDFDRDLRSPLLESLIEELSVALTNHGNNYPEDPSPIQASAAKIPFQIKTSKRVDGKFLFDGVLARIDEVSEGIPAVGTGQPLFLPLAAAEKIVEQVKASPGMFPIDADATLSRHADENIIGVIVDARIEGQDLAVSGHLFAKNVPAQINQIIRSRKPLGMSMNAMVSGYQTDMGDRTVFYLQNVDLQGANVLYADKATYTQTRFTPVAASNQTVKDNKMELEEKLARLEQMFAESQQNFTTQLAASKAENLALQAKFEVIEAEKRQQEQMQQAQLAAAAKEAEVKGLEERIAERIEASIPSIVQKMINPRLQVQSRISSTPLVQVAAQAQPEETNPVLAEIEQIDNELRVLRASNACGTVGAIGLAERKRNLQMQLAQGVM